MKRDPLPKAEEKLKAIITEHMADELKFVQDYVASLETKNGLILPTEANYAKRAKLAQELKARQKDWIQRTFASDEWIKKNTTGLPNTTIASAINWAVNYAADVSQSGALVYDRMVSAVEHITVIEQEQFNKVRETFGKAIRTPGTTYKNIIDALVNDYGTAPGHAQTITRGVLMETFRLTNAQAAVEYQEQYGDDPDEVLYQLTGPEPVPMPDGHILCVNHYGEVHSLREWREIASQYGDQGGLDINNLLNYVGGYNCRHGLRPVAKANARSAKKQTNEYKDLQKQFEKEFKNAA